MQGYIRSYALPESPWDRIASGHPGSVLLLRLLPVLLVALTLPIAFISPVMVPYANYALVFLPAFTALVNGPIATAVATLFTVAAHQSRVRGRSVPPLLRRAPGATCRRSSSSACCARRWRGSGTGSSRGCST